MSDARDALTFMEHAVRAATREPELLDEIAALKAQLAEAKAGDEQRVRDLTAQIQRADAAEAALVAADAMKTALRARTELAEAALASERETAERDNALLHSRLRDEKQARETAQKERDEWLAAHNRAVKAFNDTNAEKDDWKRTALKAEAESARLREAIENADHGRSCALITWWFGPAQLIEDMNTRLSTFDERVASGGCDCFKAALRPRGEG